MVGTGGAPVRGTASAGDDLDGAVWISVDGLNWARVSDARAGLGAPGDQEMFSVVAGGPGLVAVGYEGLAGGGWDAAVWVSADGLIWTRVSDESGELGGADFTDMRWVVVGGPGLVAVGSSGSESDTDAAVWVSPSPG